MAHGHSCSAACELFPDQGSNPCPLHWRQILNHCAPRKAPKTALLRRLLLGRKEGKKEGRKEGRKSQGKESEVVHNIVKSLDSGKQKQRQNGPG